MKGVPRERSLQARQQLGQELRRQLVAKRRAANAASASFFRLTPCPPLRHQSHQSGAVHWQRRASLYPSCPSVAANSVLFNRLFFLSAARRWRLPCLMTLLLLYPALSRHSVRRGETLNFCNGLKWSKYHSPPPPPPPPIILPPPHPPAFVTHSSPVITCCLISWCTDKGRGRFHGEGTLAVFRASLNLALCSFHSNYPESFHTFCHRTQGKDLSANCFQMEIKNNHTATLSKWLLLCSIWYGGEIDVGFLFNVPIYNASRSISRWKTFLSNAFGMKSWHCTHPDSSLFFRIPARSHGQLL